eukprot:TRINITY_DN21140_c0_g1_i1.p1 TRINITY_DN21140_c0_g1~~TRINITY_DN21140_c0_g1_i1.p1  ORF type:complete len:2110 (-),score=539.85 TRINITY_DN21140_c0_g1_i1:277-6291(-)
MANTVGKLQYRLLLSQWEKSNAQRQLQSATQELKHIRKDLLDNEEDIDKEKTEWAEEESSLQRRLTTAREAAQTFKEQAMASLPIEKARELTSKVEEIGARKTELEERLVTVRRQLHRNQTEMEELKLQAKQARELFEEMSVVDKDSEAPRQRLIEMANKLSEAKLSELRHKREAEISQEQYDHVRKQRESDAKEIEHLQKEVAKAEANLAAEAERWRERIVEMQQGLGGGLGAKDGAQPAPGAGGNLGMRINLRRASKETVENLEQLYERLVDKDAKIVELESALEKTKAEKEHDVAEERMRVRKLELELNLMNQGDTVKLRQALRAEHDAEMRQISEAAQESVTTLQSLLDQAEARVREHEDELQRVIQSKREVAEKHVEETMTLQREISGLRSELISAKHTDLDGSTRASPLVSGVAIDLDASLVSELGVSMGDTVSAPLGSLEQRLEESRQQVIHLEALFSAQQEEHSQKLQAQKLEAQRHADKITEEFRALADRRERDFQAAEEEFRRVLSQREEDFRAVIGQREQEARHHREVSIRGGEEARMHYENAVQHEANAQQHAFALERLKRENEVLRTELEAERETFQEYCKESTSRKQQAALRRQVVAREEQIGKFKKAIAELKDKVVRMTVDREKEERECELARQNESELRRRVATQEERLTSLKDQVARLTRRLEDQKEQNTKNSARLAEQRASEREADDLLGEASGRLAERVEAARRAEEASAKNLKRAEEAEAALAAARLAMEGELRIVQQEARAAAEASAQRAAGFRERIDSLEAEKARLVARSRGLEVAAQGTLNRAAQSSDLLALAELQEQLRCEQQLRAQAQLLARDLASQVELAQGKQTPAAAARSASPVLRGRRAESGSQSPDAAAVRLSADLSARCTQLQSEAAFMNSRVQRLEQENDDLKLQLVTGAAATGESDQLRKSLQSLESQNQALMSVVEAQRSQTRSTDESAHKEGMLLRTLQQQVSSLQQNLEAERTRARNVSFENDKLQQQVISIQHELDAAHARARNVAVSESQRVPSRFSETSTQKDVALSQTLQHQITSMQQDLDAERTRARNLSFEHDKAQQQINRMQQDLDAERTRARNLTFESEKLKQQVTNMQQDLDAERTRARNLSFENEKVQQQVASAQQDLDAERTRVRSISCLSVENDKLKHQMTSMQQDLDAERTRAVNLSIENDKLRRDIQDLRRDLDSGRSAGNAELASTRAQLEEMRRSMDSLSHGSVHQSQRDVAQMQSLQQQLATALQQLEAERSRSRLMTQQAEADRNRASSDAAVLNSNLQASLDKLTQENAQLRREASEAAALASSAQALQPEPLRRAPPRGGQQSQQRSGGAREVRIDSSGVREVEQDEASVLSMEARPAAESLRIALHKRGLSLVSLLADLDPAQRGAVLFANFQVTAQRLKLPLDDEDFALLRNALHVDARGCFKARQLIQLVQEASAVPEQDGSFHPGGRRGGPPVLEGLPPRRAAAAQGSRRATSAAAAARPRTGGGSGHGGGTAAAEEQDEVKAIHNRRVEALNASLKQSEEERKRLQREANELQKQLAEALEASRRNAAAAASGDAAAEEAEAAPKPIRTLLGCGDGVAVVVKDLRKDVLSTREVRERLFQAEAMLEEYRRRLEVDARVEIERERHTVAALQRELQEQERALAEADFELRRLRAAAGAGEWERQEEEYMQLNVQNRRLEEELKAKRQAEADLADKLLEQEHQLMRMQFDAEQARSKVTRLENRILELELAESASAGAGAAALPAGAGAAGSRPAARKERALEGVVDGLERVVAQQRAENQRLTKELETAKRDERRQRQNERRRGGYPEGTDAQVRAELIEKQRQIAALEEQLSSLRSAAAAASAAPAQAAASGAPPDESGGSGLGAGEEVIALQRQLRELQAARAVDTEALEEAQQALEAADLNEQRYVEVVRENKRLKADLGALGDEGFWESIDALQTRCDEGTMLAKESQAVIDQLCSAFPSVEPPRELLARLVQFASAAAA